MAWTGFCNFVILNIMFPKALDIQLQVISNEMDLIFRFRWRVSAMTKKNYVSFLSVVAEIS